MRWENGLLMVGMAVITSCAGELQSEERSRPGKAMLLEGPFVHENLVVYVVRGLQTDGRAYITLAEGLEAGTVIVREKLAGAQVNALEVENRSDNWLFLQAADIVKGGKQDRTIATDMVIPPHSLPRPVDAFCVEHGRWQPLRGGANALEFSDHAGIVSGNRLKLAIQEEKSQEGVWQEVARQEKETALALGRAVDGASSPRLSATGTYTAIIENPAMRAHREGYRKALLPPVLEIKDALGIVAAIGGEITSADVYASTSLFRKRVPQLLDSYAQEAILTRGLGRPGKNDAAPSKEPILSFLLKPAQARGQEEVTESTHRLTRETDEVVLFEYRHRSHDPEAKSPPLHKSYLKK